MQRKRNWRQRADVLSLLVVAGLLLTFAAAGFGRQTPVLDPVAEPLPTETPQPTPTGGWWDHISMTPGPRRGVPTIPSLSALPSGGSGPAAGSATQPVSFTVLACPLATTKIEKIVTDRSGGRWLVTGTATHPNLDYWKMELSANGQDWTLLYRNSTPVTNGQLLDFHTRTVAPGAYQLRLVVVDKTGNYADPCTIGVTLKR